MKSVFHNEIEIFLMLREKTMKRKTCTMDRCALHSFDQHLVKRGRKEKCITEDDVSSWVQPMYNLLSRNTIAGKIRTLRSFLTYIQTAGFKVYIPSYPKIQDTYVPYLFSDSDIEKIFSVADSVKLRKGTYRHLGLPMLLRMLYSCGFRLNELLSIQIGDIDFQADTILLRNTKNEKQRIVPMHTALSEILYRYCLAMNLLNSSKNFLFPSQNFEQHISCRAVEEWFEKLLKETGLYVRNKKHERGRCLHCFRHLFAIKSFAQAEHIGQSTADSIPYLSIYMGHSNLNETEKYLKFSSDIFPEHTSMFETYSEDIFPEVCYEK